MRISMNTWTGTSLIPLTNDPIVVIGPNGPFQRALSTEIEALPASVIAAETWGEAAAKASDSERPPSIMLIPETKIDSDEFEGQLAEFKIRAGAPHLVPIAFGRAPDDQRRLEIRQAGVDLALFGRFGRNALRFQVNRALSPWADRAPRGEQRAPKEWRTRTYSSGKEKPARCYSISSGGAYFVTPRPWIVGSDIQLELPLGQEHLLVSGHILYTNMGNGSDRRSLPRGMAVGFSPLPEHIQQAIREDVTTTHQVLEV